MVCHLFVAKPLFEPILTYSQLDTHDHTAVFEDYIFEIITPSPRGQWVKMILWIEQSCFHALKWLLQLSHYFLQSAGSGNHSIKDLGAHNPNLTQIQVAPMWKLTIRSGHYLAHAMTAELSWHVRNSDLIRSLELTS